MPTPPGTYPVSGPVVDISGALLTASTDLRDAGVISFRDGRLVKVNLAGNDWESIELPTGSSVNDRVAYINGEWVAVSSAEAGYFMLTRGETLTEMTVGLLAALNQGGRDNAVLFGASDEWAFRGSLAYSTFSAAHVTRVTDTDRPYFWIIAPNRWNWTQNFQVHSLNQPVVQMLMPVTERGSILINGISYDTAKVQLQPPDNTTWTARFVAPAALHTIVVV